MRFDTVIRNATVVTATDTYRADVGISGVDYLIAETGSVALLTRPGQPRGLTLLPPVHVAVPKIPGGTPLP